MVIAECEHIDFEIDEEKTRVVGEQVLWPADYPGWDGYFPKTWPVIPGLKLDSDSFVLGFTGPRGSGKTSLMTYTAQQCAFLYGKRIISNYPIDFTIRYCDLRREIEFEPHHSEKLDIGKLLTFDDSYKGSIIILDEAPQIINRLATMTWKNRLLDLFLQQIRKNGISFLYASQNEGGIRGNKVTDLDHGWVDGALRFQTDILAFCRDASRIDSGFERGALIDSVWVDKSGLWSGYSYFEKPRSLKFRTETKLIWNTFNTKEQFDVMESLSKVKINAPTYEIGQQGDDNYADCKGRAQLVAQAGMDKGKMATTAFYEAVGELTKKEKDRLAKELHRAGIKLINKDTDYSFRNFDMEKFLNG